MTQGSLNDKLFDVCGEIDVNQDGVGPRPRDGEMAGGRGRAGNAPEQARRRRRKDARPAEIIEAGLAEFAENGFAATRLEDVAARAGVVKGTIYRYFENKEALFRAAVHSRVVPALDEVDGLIDGFPGSSEALLTSILGTLYRRLVAGDLPLLIKIIVAEGARFPDIPAYYHEVTVSKAQRILGRVVARGVASGEFRAGAVADLPLVLMGPALMAALWRTTFEPIQPIPLDQFLAAHVELVLRGLGTDRHAPTV